MEEPRTGGIEGMFTDPLEEFEDTALYDRSGNLVYPLNGEGFSPILNVDKLSSNPNGLQTATGQAVLPFSITGRGRCYLTTKEHEAKDYRYLRLCASQLRTRLGDSKAVRMERFLHELIAGNLRNEEIHEGKQRFDLHDGESRVCAVIRYKGDSSTPRNIRDVVKAASEDSTDKPVLCIADMGEGCTAVCLTLKASQEDWEKDELSEFFLAVCESLEANYAVKSVVGIGPVFTELAQLCDSYRKAYTAADIISRRSRLSNALTAIKSPQVAAYNALLLERIADELSDDLKNRCADEYRLTECFPEDLRETVEVFFDNSLNLSEASRSLYIHRNTLVYRLDKLQKLTGFDVRRFNDAATLKLLLLMENKK